MRLLLANIVRANALGPHAACGTFQLLQHLTRILIEVGVYYHIDFGVPFGHGNRSSAEDRYRGNHIVDQHLVQAGGAYQPGGTSEDKVHFTLVDGGVILIETGTERNPRSLTFRS